MPPCSRPGLIILSKALLWVKPNKAFDITNVGKGETREPNMPSFIDAKNLKPYMGADLISGLIRLEYEELNGKMDSGYDARVIPMMCKVYLDARSAGKLTKGQVHLARASEILLVGLSNIGIIALVDEATGYQFDRERDELQKILKAYIAQELLPWQKRFPDVFYREIFRLNRVGLHCNQYPQKARGCLVRGLRR